MLLGCCALFAGQNVRSSARIQISETDPYLTHAYSLHSTGFIRTGGAQNCSFRGKISTWWCLQSSRPVYLWYALLSVWCEIRIICVSRLILFFLMVELMAHGDDICAPTNDVKPREACAYGLRGREVAGAHLLWILLFPE